MPTWQSSLMLFMIVAAGVNSGAFFAFSNFVMGPLGRLAPAEGARAIQASRYRVTWTQGNHVRAITSAASVVCLVVAVSLGG